MGYKRPCGKVGCAAWSLNMRTNEADKFSSELPDVDEYQSRKKNHYVCTISVLCDLCHKRSEMKRCLPKKK